MIEFDLPLQSFIGGWFIDTKLCDHIIKFFNSDKDNVSIGKVGNQEYKPDVKDSLDGTLHNEFLQGWYATELNKCINKYKEKYSVGVSAFTKKGGEPYTITGLNIQYYEPRKGFKKLHCERGDARTVKRELFYLTYLNTVKSGGTNFYYQNLNINAIKGLTIIAPASFTHLHKGNISNDQEKYIITGWLEW